MTSLRFLVAAVLVSMALFVSNSAAFAPASQMTTNIRSSAAVKRVSPLNIFDEKERDALTRDSEPEEYFQT